MASTNSISYGYINDTISTGISAFESKLRSTMAAMADSGDGSLTSQQMLQMQQQVQQWTIMVEIQSTITKQLADSLKSVVQKSG
ncbi:EscF/YscF/HrpA family type III secretion system needle major subunit [Achromobacter xylosoxidans]